jgi:NAD(P)H-dependent FMN reductase
LVKPLNVEQVYRACPEDAFDFEITSELESLDMLSGHDRARDALDFGTAMRSEGFNLYVLGHPGHGKHQMVGRFLTERSRDEPTPPDIAYRYNFDDASLPLHLLLPTGMGRVLRADIEQLAEELRGAIPAVFEGDEYQNRVHELKQAMGERQRDVVEAIRREAQEHDILLLSTPNGFTFAPATADEKMMSPEQFEKLDQEDRERIEGTVAVLQKKLTKAIRQMPRLAKQLREQIKNLNEEMLQTAIDAPLAELEERYQDHDGIQEHLKAIREAMVLHVDSFIEDDPNIPPEAIFSRFHINLIVDNTHCEGARWSTSTCPPTSIW